MGLRIDWLGTGRLSWRDLLVIVRQAPPTSRLAVALVGEAAQWTIMDRLLARLIYAVEAGNWQRGGGKGHRPRPIRIPKPKGAGERSQIKRDVMSLDELDRKLGWKSPRLRDRGPDVSSPRTPHR
jgi:hypothetical protein